MSNVLTIIRKNENNFALYGLVKSLDAECGNCAPITPLQCISGCQVYKLKNELRLLRKTMSNPDYTKNLFNALKNKTRLCILEAIVDGRCTVLQLQEFLRRTGQSQSQDTIIEDHLRPLMAVGLVSEERDEYYASSFGSRLTKLLGGFPELAAKLPAKSGCYEEALLQSLLSGSKTFEEIEAVIAPNIVSRILKRLRSAGLLEASSDRECVFFFKSKRDPKKEIFTAMNVKFTMRLLMKEFPLVNLQGKQGCLRE